MVEASKLEHALQLPAPALLSAAMAHEGLEVTLTVHRPARRGGGPLSVADRAAAVRTVGLYEGAGLLSRGDLAEGDDITYAFPDRVESGRVDEVLGLCDNVALVARSAAPTGGWDVAVRQAGGCWHGVASFPRSDDGYEDAETAAVQHARKAQPRFGEVDRVISPGAARGFLLEIADLLRSSADDHGSATPHATTLIKITELLRQAGVVGPFASFLPPRDPVRAGGDPLSQSEDVATRLALRHLDRGEKELVETAEIVLAPSLRAESQAAPAPALQGAVETGAVETAAAAGASPHANVGTPPPSSPSASGQAPAGPVVLDGEMRPAASEVAAGAAAPTRPGPAAKKREKHEPIAKEKPDAASKDA